ncbi:uncharacterized protein EKO05_0000709 [Ascochyta rabiei]|uniref:Uncharacterized protein n=1 Tax=Didymella rabiei TaxID=5454 RepID=A0A163B451_DIDRA|nr:uncharacterized protein EKO05_0000709 [Ascochyta rabiei]KZM21559.1 hypothetical protein ST47_g7282 [Ascochyta rabiei]UPX10033.1 hypothetical protein EKO05_0000709 [Ascochyta rabiei]
MVCRNEHPTDTNSVGLTAMLCELRLERIAQTWRDRCTVKHNIWANEYNRRIEEKKAQEEDDKMFIEKCTVWWKECRELANQLRALFHKFRTNHPVTPADWEALTAGKERKVFAVLSTCYPKETWPRSVPYLNLIAHALYEEEEDDRRLWYMEQYLVAMEDIRRRGEEVLGTKRIMGNSSARISFQAPLTEAQVLENRETLRVKKQQLQADKAQFFAELYDFILARLHGHVVLDGGWDVDVWAESVLEEIGIIATDEVKEHVVHFVHQMSDEPIDESEDMANVAFEQDINCEGEFFLPYDV